MLQITNADGIVVRRSKNLRGLKEHGRKHYLRSVFLTKLPKERGRLVVFYENDDLAEIEFESYRVMCEFVAAWRATKLAHIFKR